MALVETESLVDHQAIRAVHLAAFPTPIEADLVARLRAGGHAEISLVAREGGAVVGHVLFSPVTVHAAEEGAGAVLARGLGLAPLAVLPDFQRRGVGSELVEAGLARCRESGVGFVVVLGDPEFYGRFAFQPASRFGLSNEYGAGDAFQVLPLDTAALPARGGLVRYGEEFAGLE